MSDVWLTALLVGVAAAGWATALVLVGRLRRARAALPSGASPAATAEPGSGDTFRQPLDQVIEAEPVIGTPIRAPEHTGASRPPELGGEPAPAALLDPITGLFNEEFFLITLESRVSSARRHLRPVALALLEVAQGVREGTPEPVDARVIADGLRTTLREADTACHLPDGSFALVLEDTPENGAVWTVERLRRHLVVDHPRQTLWAGVACYPAHAFDAGHILERASLALAAAKDWRQDRIEVATSEP